MEKMTNVKKLTLLSVLTAIVILFQFMGSFIKIGATSISLVLIPIVLGGILTGIRGGAFLGFVFGAITLWSGVSGTDPFTNVLFVSNPFATSLLCLGKAILAGAGAGLVYKLLKNKSTLLASVLASMAAPIINTGIFILGGLFLLSEPLSQMTGGASLTYFLVVVCAGINFIAEFAVNAIVSPAINTLVKAVTKK
ncbi:MAG: ECF transporter S component [Clostridia bacterium]|nr:ECF transporter S component [Clostridia bacterium]